MHTLGPWKVDEDMIVGANGDTVCLDTHMSRDDARLIAAAPIQNDALVLALEWWHSDARHMSQKEPAWVPAARDAITKATKPSRLRQSH